MRGLGGGKGGGWMGDFLPTFPELMDGAQRYKLDFVIFCHLRVHALNLNLRLKNLAPVKNIFLLNAPTLTQGN